MIFVNIFPSVGGSNRRKHGFALCILPLMGIAGCNSSQPMPKIPPAPLLSQKQSHLPPSLKLKPEIAKLMESVRLQTTITKSYDQSYRRIAYPMGDVPMNTGVCTDVVIRAFRAADVDLQELVHIDMKGNIAAYPRKWGSRAPDTNIDHRRVPNLETFFIRSHRSLPISMKVKDFLPGDIVSWQLGSLTHIGIVTDMKSSSGTPLIAHNIGSGTKIEDILFSWNQRGHFRWF